MSRCLVGRLWNGRGGGTERLIFFGVLPARIVEAMGTQHDPVKFPAAETRRRPAHENQKLGASKALQQVGRKQVLGWKESVWLPELGNIRVLAKLDTGARTSALHAVNLQFRRSHLKWWVEFDLPDVDDPASRHFRLPLIEHRKIKSSIGSSQVRPVVLLEMTLAGQTWATEVTLTDRSDMELPMLVGRSALKGRFLVDPARTRLANPRKP